MRSENRDFYIHTLFMIWNRNINYYFSGDVPGLKWLNDEKTIFRMPWKHAGRQDYNLEDSKIFMEWAKHSGRYREGIDKPEVIFLKFFTLFKISLFQFLFIFLNVFLANRLENTITMRSQQNARYSWASWTIKARYLWSLPSLWTFTTCT